MFRVLHDLVSGKPFAVNFNNVSMVVPLDTEGTRIYFGDESHWENVKETMNEILTDKWVDESIKKMRNK